jgi:hypothetical protein
VLVVSIVSNVVVAARVGRPMYDPASRFWTHLACQQKSVTLDTGTERAILRFALVQDRVIETLDPNPAVQLVP